MNAKGTLYLIPSTLGEDSPVNILPGIVPETIRRLRRFVVEDVRTARRFLKKILPDIVIDDLSFQILNEHTPPDEIPALLAA